MNSKHVGQALGSGGTKEGRKLRVTVEGHCAGQDDCLNVRRGRRSGRFQGNMPK